MLTLFICSYLSLQLILYTTSSNIHPLESIQGDGFQNQNCQYLVMGRLLTLEYKFVEMQYKLLERINYLEQQNKKLGEQNENLNDTVSGLQTRITHLERHNGALNNTLESRLLGRSSPAFVVKRIPPAIFNPYTTVVFPQIVTDAGNNYNTSTGKFTATVPGRYLFSLSVRSQFKNLCHPRIYKNNIDVAYAFSGHSVDNWSSSASVTSVLDLEVDDEVYVYEANEISNGTYEDGSFTGVLLFTF